MTNQSPRGGTELQFEYLRKHVDPKLLDQFEICTSVPEKIPLSLNKINILWQKNSWDQGNLINWFQDKSNHDKYDWYVFNSNWNFEQFTKKFELPTEKCLVIKNGIENIEPVPTIYKKGEPVKIIHHCTPWRGLSVLLGAMQLVKNPLISLDVYSSTEVYGKAFHDHNDHHYHDLYNQAKKLPNVNYIGYKPNEYIKEHLKDYQLFVYPSIWEETSCISLLATHLHQAKKKQFKTARNRGYTLDHGTKEICKTSKYQGHHTQIWSRQAGDLIGRIRRNRTRRPRPGYSIYL